MLAKSNTHSSWGFLSKNFSDTFWKKNVNKALNETKLKHVTSSALEEKQK